MPERCPIMVLYARNVEVGEIMTGGQPSPQEIYIHGRLINLIRSGQATTRPTLEQATGLGRRVVAHRVQQAIDAGLIDDSTYTSSEIGRPSRVLRFRAEVGLVYVGMIESSQLWAAVATLDGELVDSLHQDWDSDVGAEATLTALKRMFGRLGRRARIQPWAIGIGISGLVDFERGRLVSSLLLPGWDDFSVRAWMRDQYDVPVWVERNTNLMALGEWHRGSPRSQRDLMYLMVDEEVGAAVVSRGRLFRGDSGAAGDIGHSQVTDDPTVLCKCGRTGCLEAVVSGWSLVTRLSARLDESPYLSVRMQTSGRINAQDIGDAARAGDPVAYGEVAAGIRVLGSAVANYVNFANPGTLVIGGGMLRVGSWTVELLETEIRSRLTAGAGADLLIRAASLDHREGLVGAAILAVEQLFGPSSVGLWIDNGTPVGRAAALQRALVV